MLLFVTKALLHWLIHKVWAVMNSSVDEVTSKLSAVILRMSKWLPAKIVKLPSA